MSNNDKWLPFPRFLLRRDALLRLLKNHQIENKKCLEIGFGSGEILKLMAQKGANVVGFDFSDEAINTAKKRISESTFKHKIKITNDENLLIKNHYDFVLALEVLEHIEDDRKVFEKWLSYVKPGGNLIISVPAHMSKWCKNDVWAGHIKRYERYQLLELCDSKNITIKHLWNYGYPLTLLLDKLINSNKKDIDLETRTSQNEKIELTKKSGIDRDNNFIYRLISNNIVLYPFFILQRLFFNKDLGSCYIMHVTVNEK